MLLRLWGQRRLLFILEQQFRFVRLICIWLPLLLSSLLAICVISGLAPGEQPVAQTTAPKAKDGALGSLGVRGMCKHLSVRQRLGILRRRRRAGKAHAEDAADHEEYGEQGARYGPDSFPEHENSPAEGDNDNHRRGRSVADGQTGGPDSAHICDARGYPEHARDEPPRGELEPAHAQEQHREAGEEAPEVL